MNRDICEPDDICWSQLNGYIHLPPTAPDPLPDGSDGTTFKRQTGLRSSTAFCPCSNYLLASILDLDRRHASYLAASLTMYVLHTLHVPGVLRYYIGLFRPVRDIVSNS